jgi:hypothetical protein
VYNETSNDAYRINRGWEWSMQTCPHCGKENADVDAYCYACGHILPAAVQEVHNATQQLADLYEAMEPRRRWGTAYFDRRNKLQIYLRDLDQTFTIEVNGEVVLGRSHDEPSLALPDVDLTPYNAAEYGVSRRHLALTRDHDTISVVDLGSANNTYLNGQRLIPNEHRILRDNDELRLGRLVIRVAFI